MTYLRPGVLGYRKLTALSVLSEQVIYSSMSA